MMQETYTVL